MKGSFAIDELSGVLLWFDGLIKTFKPGEAMRLGIVTTLLGCCYLTLTVGAQEPHHPEQEGPRRIERVMQAAENLEQAGLHEEARAMRERAEMMQRELRAQHEHHGDHGEPGPLPEIMHQLEVLRDQVQQMRNELRETHQLVEALRNELRNRPHPSPFPPVLGPGSPYGEPTPYGEPKPRKPQIIRPIPGGPTEEKGPSENQKPNVKSPVSDEFSPFPDAYVPEPFNPQPGIPSTSVDGASDPTPTGTGVPKVIDPFASSPTKLISF